MYLDRVSATSANLATLVDDLELRDVNLAARQSPIPLSF